MLKNRLLVSCLVAAHEYLHFVVSMSTGTVELNTDHFA
jgi:hypothetical protein